MVQLYNSADITTDRKRSRFILSERSDFHMLDNLSVTVHSFPMRMLILLSVDEILLLRYVNWLTNFRGLPLKMEMDPSCLMRLNTDFSVFLVAKASCSRQCSRNLDRVGILVRSTRSYRYFASAEYHVLLVIFNVKPFSFIRTIDVDHDIIEADYKQIWN